MSARDDGGPAFPINPDTNISHKGEIYPESSGMTLRDWFAGQALVGYVSDPATAGAEALAIAMDCYVFADAMLAARESGSRS